MPIQPNVIERTVFFKLNAAPAPMLDLVGALAYQIVSTAVRLNVFAALRERPSGPGKLAQTLGADERGTRHLLAALAAIGYVSEKDGRYHNTPMTEKWFLDGAQLDMGAMMTCWGAFLAGLWPHAPEVVRTGERPFDFYEFTARDPALNDAHQRMMMGNANMIGPDVVKMVALPDGASRLLDVGGGHGQFTAYFCAAHLQLTATILDSEIALDTARPNMAAAGLSDRVDLYAADLWAAAWGEAWDAVLLFNLLHHYDLDTNRRLLRKAYDALRPGGKVAILDQVAGKQSGPATNAIVQLVGFMYYLFADGRTFTRKELTDLLAGAGFHDIQYHSLRAAPGNGLLVGEK